MKAGVIATLLGGIITVILGTACCWLPALLIFIGAGTGLLAFTEGLHEYSAYIMLGGASLVFIGAVQVFKRRSKTSTSIITHSTIACPNCGHKSTEEMPPNACQYFLECNNCQKLIQPKKGDCCVYCSYGDVPCPPIQSGMDCC